LQTELDEIIAADCLLCGDIMINSIDTPFIDEDEEAEILAWAL
jgi:vacuolar protein sorting-associated protein 18